jgi:integrase
MAKGEQFMLSEAVNRHIDLHRSMGFKYAVQAYMLRSFADFAQARCEDFVQTESVLEWASSAPSVRQRHDRLLTVRRMAAALNAEDKRHQVPPTEVFGRARRSRRICHIFTQDEIALLLRTASRLTPTASIRPVTYSALLSLIACTGLRVSEALKLDLSDFTEDGLVIRATKFQKSRLVPLHESARRGIQQYVAARNRIATTTSTVFVSQRGCRLPYPTVNATFLHLARSAGLRGGPGLGGCRIHDLRHTFAVRSLEECAGDRRAVERHITALSTYLGHAHVADTYWYLQAAPSLMAQIADAGEAFGQAGAP